MTHGEFIALVRKNPAVATILDRMPSLAAPDAWLTAGCLAQTVWNLQTGRPPGENIRDYDLFYFDEDLGWDAEDEVIRRGTDLFGRLPVEIRNQARVHLWFGPKFGYDIPPLRSACEGIDRFLFRGICIGISADGRIYAPFGLGDLLEGLLRPNPGNLRIEQMLAKAEDYRDRWPHLRIETA
jgi:hypothetical protein